MAVITSSTTLDTEFTPAAGDFIASSTKRATLLRKNHSSADFVVVGSLKNEAVVIDNPVSGAVYKWAAGDSTTTVTASQ